MSDPERVPPSGGPGHWRRWLLPVLASAAWLVLTFCLYRHAVQGEQAHLLELCHTRLAATAHQLMDARDWNAGHGGVYVPLSAYGEPNPWLPEKDRTLQTADGRTLVLMNPAYMSRQMAERLTEPGFRLAIVGQAPLRPGNRADDWERRILATATQGGQIFFSGEDCLPQGRLRLLRTLAAQESCLRCHQGHKEGDMLGGISISMDAAAYVRDLERKQRELGLLYGLLALTGVLAVGGITSNLTLRRLQAEEKSRLKSAFMGRLSHDMRTPLAAMLGMNIPNGAFPGETAVPQEAPQPLVLAAVDQFGPMDFKTMDAQARENGMGIAEHDLPQSPESKYLGMPVAQAPDALCERANPLSYAGARMAPMLVQHGTADRLVPCAQSEEFVRGLREKGLGDRVFLTLLEGAGHGDRRFGEEENQRVVFGFVQDVLAGRKPAVPALERGA